MKKKKMYITIAVIVVAIAAYFLIDGYFKSEGYFLSKLPEKYKSYPILENDISTRNYTVVKLFTGARPRQIYQESTQNIVVIEKMEEFRSRAENENTVLSFTYYRIDKSGKVLGSLTTKSNSSNDDFVYEYNGHLLSKNGYNNFIRDGKDVLIPYININQDLKMPKNELTSLLSQFREKAEGVKEDYEGELKIYTVSIDGTVQKLFTKSEMEIAVEYKFQTNFNLLPAVNEYVDGVFYNWANKKAPIYIDYFLKQQYNSASSSGPFSPAPTSRPANWEGIGYFNIPLGTDTVKFKHVINYYPQKDSGFKPYYNNYHWGQLDYFESPNYDFKIITVGYNNDHVHELDGCYLIVPKR
ncbi:MAG: hypothetical protein EOO47_01625 [Flavobacterium sp.]|nr:MAG: hypothetical protein EOO47_01625 [Flavobacterium sp.]